MTRPKLMSCANCGHDKTRHVLKFTGKQYCVDCPCGDFIEPLEPTEPSEQAMQIARERFGL